MKLLLQPDVSMLIVLIMNVDIFLSQEQFMNNLLYGIVL